LGRGRKRRVVSECMETEVVLSKAHRRVKSPSPLMRGMTIIPFGLVLGFTSTALPFLLTHDGIPLGRVAGISATVFSPTVYAFLMKPLLDTGFSRKTYSWALLLIGAVTFAAGMSVLGPGHLRLAVPLLLIASLSMVLYTGAVNGWISAITPDEERGSVGGWYNVANLGAAAMGSFVVMSLVSHGWVTQKEVGLGLGVVVILTGLPLLALPDPKPACFKFKEVLTGTPKAIWKAVKRRECLVGFALLLTPAAGTAAQNLQSGLGPDFGASTSTVVLVTGIGSALVASFGAWFGGKLADRFPRMYLYLFAGFGTATTSLVTAFLPHTAHVFIGSTLVYNFAVGIIYAAYQTVGFELTGDSPVASTQLGMFAASINANLVYMTMVDGAGYRWDGVRGLYLVDGLASIAAIVPLLFLVWWVRGKKLALAS
jgi:MFS family permease